MLKYILMFQILLMNSCKEAPMDTTNNEIRQLTKSESQLVNSNQNFGLSIFQKVNEAKPGENIFVSPISISFALGMTLNGAASSTYDSIKKALFITDLSRDEINNSYRSLMSFLSNLDKKVKFKIANAIFYRNSLSFKKNFIDLNREYFKALVQGLDFSNTNSVDVINEWVNENTEGKIPTIVEKIPQHIIMYILNAIYFKGDWKYAFDKEMTKDALFWKTKKDSVKCKMMYRTINVRYFENEDVQWIELPYANGHFCMNILLPKKDINDFIKSLNSEYLDLISKNSFETEIKLYVPKFKLRFKISLKDILTKMGMGLAFNPDLSDFTNLYEGVQKAYISDAIHSTYVDVYEEGTEAAAVTSIEIGITSVREEKIMRCDKPFVFLIREKNSNSVLFIGKLLDPSAGL